MRAGFGVGDLKAGGREAKCPSCRNGFRRTLRFRTSVLKVERTEQTQRVFCTTRGGGHYNQYSAVLWEKWHSSPIARLDLCLEHETKTLESIATQSHPPNPKSNTRRLGPQYLVAEFRACQSRLNPKWTTAGYVAQMTSHFPKRGFRSSGQTPELPNLGDPEPCRL